MVFQKFFQQIDAEFSPLQIYQIKIGGRHAQKKCRGRFLFFCPFFLPFFYFFLPKFKKKIKKSNQESKSKDFDLRCNVVEAFMSSLKKALKSQIFKT